MKQKPSLQFYPQDFLGSLDVQLMTAEEVGVYCLLLFNCFNNGGLLPADPEKLKLLCRGCVPSENVMKKFYAYRNADASFLRNERVDFEIKKQKKFSREMKVLSDKRWKKANPSVSDTHSVPVSSSSSSSSSIPSSSFHSEEGGGSSNAPTPSETMKEFIQLFEDRNERYQKLLEKISERWQIPVEKISAELDKFINYWREKTRDGRKEKWQLEKTFEVQRRLVTWFSNAQRYSKNDSQKTIQSF